MEASADALACISIRDNTNLNPELIYETTNADLTKLQFDKTLFSMKKLHT